MDGYTYYAVGSFLNAQRCFPRLVNIFCRIFLEYRQILPMAENAKIRIS